MQRVLRLDYETYSDVNLKTRGLDQYSEPGSNCEILMLAYALDNNEIGQWVPSEDGPMPGRLRRAIEDPTITKSAWNAQFERVISTRIQGLKTDYKDWRCTMVQAGMLSLPMGLEDCGEVMRLGDKFKKNSRGYTLIRLFCVPHEPTKKHPYTRYTKETHPVEWKEFKAYNRQDVVAERHIGKILDRYPILESQWDVYALDQKINDRGVPIDMLFVRNAILMMDRRKKELLRDLNKSTGLRNANSGAQLLPWLRARGYPFDNLKKERVAKALTDFKESLTPECDAALRMRQISARTSVTKFRAFVNRVGADGRLRYAFQMAGAGRTCRWAGRGVQLQNLPRPARAYKKWLGHIRDIVRAGDYDELFLWYGDPILALSSSLRSAIAAPEGKVLNVSDLSAIETRLTGWQADCKFLNDIFKEKVDPYRYFASHLYGKPMDQIDDMERQENKPVTLGGGYGLSPGREVGAYPDITKTGLLGYAESMGILLSQAQAAEQIAFYRKKCHEVVTSWAALDAGAMEAIESGQRVTVGPVEFDVMAPFLRMKLPSGRHIYYLRPLIRDHLIKHPGGEFTKRGISYEGKNKIGHWTRVTTHGGKWVEQICQASGYDILAESMLEMDAVGIYLVMHVHDEPVAESKNVMLHEEMSHILRKDRKAFPDLLLDAAGYSDIYFRKD